MEDFELSIEMGNDAMQDAEDVASALERVVARLRAGSVQGTVVDDNGNRVGSWKLTV